MSENKFSEVLKILRSVKYTGMPEDIMGSGMVRDLKIEGNTVKFSLNLPPSDEETPYIEIKDVIQSKLKNSLDMDADISINVADEAPKEHQHSDNPFDDQAPLPGIKNVVAVASGKGGVGKSTVAVNLACAMAQNGLKVGLLDADIYGPSIPMMMGVIKERPMANENRKIMPIESYGIKMMSMGFLMDAGDAVIWRGPMVMKALEQFLKDVDWGELDVLVVDLPPGTGDAQLTLVQTVPLTGAVIVSTPQDVALLDAKKGVAMFQKVKTRILGIIENMSGFVCPHCNTMTPILGKGGGMEEARKLGVPFLGAVPIDPTICEGGDSGQPFVTIEGDNAQKKVFSQLAENLAAELKVKA
jgi:ATP-binding protein involved in chromosome partitioning